jgi:hypothetical protein
MGPVVGVGIRIEARPVIDGDHPRRRRIQLNGQLRDSCIQRRDLIECTLRARNHLCQQHRDVRHHQPELIHDPRQVINGAFYSLPLPKIVVTEMDEHDVGLRRRSQGRNEGKSFVGPPAPVPFVILVEVLVQGRTSPHPIHASHEVLREPSINQLVPQPITVARLAGVRLGNRVSKRHDPSFSGRQSCREDDRTDNSRRTNSRTPPTRGQRQDFALRHTTILQHYLNDCNGNTSGKLDDRAAARGAGERQGRAAPPPRDASAS